MRNYNNEIEILKDIQDKVALSHLVNGNLFEENIKNFFASMDLNGFSNITANNRKEANPPDFYSVSQNIMFDVMRVFDSEEKYQKNGKTKYFNQTFKNESKTKNELKEILTPNIDINIITEDWTDINIHTFERYKNHVQRVIDEHLSSDAHKNKINELWKRTCPDITRKGFVICDETEGFCQNITIEHFIGEQYIYKWEKGVNPKFHKPWLDSNFVKKLYDSDCDFVVWFMPYKPYSFFTRQEFKDYPIIVIMDTRHTKHFEIYDEQKLLRL